MTDQLDIPRLSPGSAMIVVDMLNDFCADDGVMPVPGAPSMYDTFDTLTEHARSAGSPVVWACDSHYHSDREFDIRPQHCLGGTWGAQIVDELHQSETDYYIPKRTFSAFFATDLDLLLRELAVHSVIIIGVMTNICVRATVHDAFFRGYRVIVPADCVATVQQRDQESTLDDIRECFGYVTTAHEITKTAIS